MTLRRAISRIEIWDKLECDGGVRLAFARNITSAVSSWSLEGDETLKFSLPSRSNAASAISDLRIARCWRADDDFDEWLIAPTSTTRARGGTVAVTCWPINYLLSIRGLVPEWQITDPKGEPLLDVGVSQLTVEEILQTYLIDNTRINGDMPWLGLGTIDPTALIDVNWSSATRRAVINACLDALAGKGVLAEFRLRRNGTTGYLVDILSEVGSTAPLLPLRIGRNLQTLTRLDDPTERVTRMKPDTATIGGGPTFLGNARWLVTNNASGVLTLADPAGGPGPVGFDDQFNTIGAYYLFREITAQAYAITDSAVSPNTVTITGDPGIAVGEFVQFRTSATAGSKIAVGPGGGVGTLSRGYILPLLATAKATNTLTIAQPISAPAAPSADSQYVGDDVAFSNFVQTSTAGFTPSDGWPTYTVTWVSGTDFSALAVGDWCISGDLSIWEGGGGLGSSLPPMTVTAITDSTHIQVTVRGAGPSFAQGVGSTPLQFFRPVAANLTGTVTASSASARTVTVDDASSLVATTGAPCALELSYTPVAGELPYYLDHPIYASETTPGIGIKFGTMDRGELAAVANLSPNALARNWTAGAPNGYAIAGAGATMTQNTDPLFTELGGSSILVTFAGGQQYFDTPPIAWRPGYKGQRFSARAHLLIPALWSGNAILDMRFGIVKADGTRKMWFPPDPQLRMMPPDAVNPPSDAQKPVAGAWFDAVLNGFDITTAQGLGNFSAVGVADLADAVAYFVRFYNTQGVPPFYFDGISITPSDVAVDAGNITEFGQANNAWQDTNVALGLLAPRQESVSVDLVDLARLNPALRDTDSIVLGGTVLVNDQDLALTNQRWRIVEIPERDELVPAKVRITLASRTKRFTDLFLKRVTSLATSGAASTAASQSSGNGTTTVTPPSGSGTPPGGTTGTSLPSITLGVALDASFVPTATAVGNSVVVRVKIAGRTDRFPTADEVRAETSITAVPFVTTFTAIASGQTEYVTALGYDAAGNESAPAQASATAGTTTPAVPWMFLRKGTQQFQSRAGTTAASGTDPVGFWGDSLGSGRSATASPVAGSDDPRPLLDGSGAVNTGARAAGVFADLNLPDMSAFTEGVIMVRIKTKTSPAETNLWQIGAGLSAAVALYPDPADGHIKDNFGINGRTDFGDPGVALDVYRTYEVVQSATERTERLDDVEGYTTSSPPAASFSSAPRLSGHLNTDYFDGVWQHILIFDFVPTEAQLQAWRDFLDGTSPTAPTDTSGTGGSSPITLSAVFSGGDVIVTADVRFASSVKMDASTSATPSDATVRATTALTARPFAKTFPAPTGTDVLHVKAFAYYDVLGGAESIAATLNISAAPIPATTADVASVAGAEFVTTSASGALSAERVLTDTATITKDVGTAGQVKLNVPDASLGVAKLSATGTPSSTTFLRGDNSWQAPAGGSASPFGASFDGTGLALTLTGTTKVAVGPTSASGALSKVAVLSTVSASVTFGVKKCARSAYPGSLADVTGGHDVVLTSASSMEDSTLTGWSTSFSADDVYEIELKTVDGVVKQATILLYP